MFSAAQDEINIQTTNSIIWIRQITQLAVMALDFSYEKRLAINDRRASTLTVLGELKG